MWLEPGDSVMVEVKSDEVGQKRCSRRVEVPLWNLLCTTGTNYSLSEGEGSSCQEYFPPGGLGKAETQNGHLFFQ